MEVIKLGTIVYKKSGKSKSYSPPFFKNPPDGAEHVQKCIESKNRHHFEKATF